jgi:hypothetical protein
VVIDWSAYVGDRFSRYVTLRDTDAAIPAAYPPRGGAVEVEGASTTARGTTSAVDVGGTRGARRYYRTLALDGEGLPLAASVARPATAWPILDLGGLAVSGEADSLVFGWRPFRGSESCFGSYRLVYGIDDPAPSYLEGSPLLWSGESQAADGVDGLSLEPGRYHFRLQVIRATELGSFVVARTDVRTFTVAP